MNKIHNLDTEQQIEFIKESFLQALKKELHLHQVFAPLFVKKETGLNDNLNGVEQPITFTTPHTKEVYEIVHSLAKWKRMRLQELAIPSYQGIITRMIAIRPEEQLTSLHSTFVDQWDWEMSILPSDRNLDFLKDIVKRIYSCIYLLEKQINDFFPELISSLPQHISFVHAKELHEQYPHKTPQEREDIVAKKYGAVFIMGIGGDLGAGDPHDGRAPDYDDWNLNGDIIVWHPILKRAFEISSMGIRVDATTMKQQLKVKGMEEKEKLSFHKSLLQGELPQSIGGGIGQSRLAMFMLKKEHIGQVQYC